MVPKTILFFTDISENCAHARQSATNYVKALGTGLLIIHASRHSGGCDDLSRFRS